MKMIDISSLLLLSMANKNTEGYQQHVGVWFGMRSNMIHMSDKIRNKDKYLSFAYSALSSVIVVLL